MFDNYSEFEGNFIEYDIFGPRSPSPSSYQVCSWISILCIVWILIILEWLQPLVPNGYEGGGLILLVKTENGPEFKIEKNFARFFLPETTLPELSLHYF